MTKRQPQLPKDQAHTAYVNPLATFSLGPKRVTVQVGTATYDVEVTYNDVDGARLHRLTIYERTPGAGLDRSDLSVALSEITHRAIEMLAEVEQLHAQVHEQDGDNAASTRDAMRRRLPMRWTSQVEEHFLKDYRALLAAGEPAIHKRLVDKYPITLSRSMNKLAELRRKHGVEKVPLAPVGRPPKEPEPRVKRGAGGRRTAKRTSRKPTRRRKR